MANPLFNKFGNPRSFHQQNNGGGLSNILSQYRQIQNGQLSILDVLLQNNKITTQQYNELQQFRNDPKKIVDYLANHGNAAQLNDAQKMIGK